MKTFFLLPLLTAILILSGCLNNTDKQPAGPADGRQPAQKDSSASWAMVSFVKQDSVNPVLQPGDGSFTDPILKHKVRWEEKDVFNPATVVRGERVYLLYRAQDKTGKPAGTSRIGLAVSRD